MVQRNGLLHERSLCNPCMWRIAVGQIVAKVRRLIVGHVLPCNTHAIGMVVHQRWNTIVGGFVRREHVKRGTVALIPKDDFLAPIAEDVGLQVRRVLGAVARRRVAIVVRILTANVEASGATAVPTVYRRSIEELLLQVAIPEDAEVHRCTSRRNGLSCGGTTLATVVSRAEESAAVAVRQLCSNAASIVNARVTPLKDDFARCCIVQIP